MKFFSLDRALPLPLVAGVALLVVISSPDSARATTISDQPWVVGNFSVYAGDYIERTGYANGVSFQLNNGNFYDYGSTMDFLGDTQIGTYNLG